MTDTTTTSSKQEPSTYFSSARPSGRCSTLAVSDYAIFIVLLRPQTANVFPLHLDFRIVGDLQRYRIFSRLVTVPQIPKYVITLSPFFNPSIIAFCCFCFFC